MPKNRHFTFGDMQAQKAREQQLAKLRAMMKPAEVTEPDKAGTAAGDPETNEAVAAHANPAAKPAQKKPIQAKAAPAKKSAQKPAPKNVAAKKKSRKK